VLAVVGIGSILPTAIRAGVRVSDLHLPGSALAPATERDAEQAYARVERAEMEQSQPSKQSHIMPPMRSFAHVASSPH
jgi:hypothetical protein